MGGTYHVIINQVGYLQTCKLNGLTFDNAAIQVDVSLLSGNYAELIFRHNGSQDYRFGITNQGKFFFAVNSNYLIQNTKTTAIAPGKQKNTLLVIAKGSDFRFYINRVFVGEEQDSTSASGSIGFGVAVLAPTTSGEGSFSNLKVFKV